MLGAAGCEEEGEEGAEVALGLGLGVGVAVGTGVSVGSGVGVVAARMGERHALLAVVTDDLIGKGMRADTVVREVAKIAGGKGGGRPHMAQASTGEPERTEQALEKVAEIVRPMLEAAGA